LTRQIGLRHAQRLLLWGFGGGREVDNGHIVMPVLTGNGFEGMSEVSGAMRIVGR
jgi:hypothetical protein